MKTALVTGSSGFVGRHMSKALLMQGFHVTGWDLPDVDAYQAWSNLGNYHIYDLVVHCAYCVGGRKGIESDKTALLRNLELDTALFSWALRTGQRRIVYYSSSAAYPTHLQTKTNWRRLKEDDFGKGLPDADYGLAKITGETLAKNYASQGGIVHIIRPFSGYGEDQSLDYPFPSFIQRAKERRNPFDIWGDLSSNRDWIHIDDVIGGTLAIVEADYREPINLCTGIATSMETLANECVKKMGYTALMNPIMSAPTGVFSRVGDASNMKKIYTPRVTLEEGIRRAFQ